MSRSHTLPSRHGIGPRRSTTATTALDAAVAPRGKECAPALAQITDRPTPARTAPIRDAASLGHIDPGTDPLHQSPAHTHDSTWRHDHDAALEEHVPVSTDDARTVVPIAYRVIDRYVEDGQKAAQNWTHAGDARPSSRPAEHDVRRAAPTHHDAPPAADHLISEAIAAMVSSRGLASVASALPAVLAALAPEGQAGSSLETLVREAQRLLSAGPARAPTQPTFVDPTEDIRADLWKRLGGGTPTPVGNDGIPVSTTGWLPGSHGD